LPTDDSGQVAETVAGEAQDRGQQFRCPRCGCAHMKRMRREGFLQQKICSIFGYYPWRCTKCLGSFLIRKRALPKGHRGPMPAVEQIADSGGAQE
jgi:hypothetical protein